MLNDKPSMYWKVCWKYIAPIFIIVVFFASLIGMMVNGIGYERWDVSKVRITSMLVSRHASLFRSIA
jgi:hypothetical protein